MRLLVLDDDDAVLAFVADLAKLLGYESTTAIDAVDLVEILNRFKPDIILTDLIMPALDGVEIMRVLAQANCGAKIIVLSHTDEKTRTAAVRLGRQYGLSVDSSVAKPLTAATLSAALRKASNSLVRLSRADVKRALAEHEFAVHYQPKISLTDWPSWRVTGADA